MKFVIFFAMMFCHIIDDFVLQGCLANLKQRAWWLTHERNPMYNNDYRMALLAHAFSWSFMMNLPLLMYFQVYNSSMVMYIIPSYILNMFIHARIDTAKCNDHTINLVTDQTLHLIQILITYLIYMWII